MKVKKFQTPSGPIDYWSLFPSRVIDGNTVYRFLDPETLEVKWVNPNDYKNFDGLGGYGYYDDSGNRVEGRYTRIQGDPHRPPILQQDVQTQHLMDRYNADRIAGARTDGIERFVMPWAYPGEALNYGLGTIMEHAPEGVLKALSYGRYISPSYWISRASGETDDLIMSGQSKFFGTGTGSSLDALSGGLLGKMIHETPTVAALQNVNPALKNWGMSKLLSRNIDEYIDAAWSRPSMSWRDYLSSIRSRFTRTAEQLQDPYAPVMQRIAMTAPRRRPKLVSKATGKVVDLPETRIERWSPEIMTDLPDITSAPYNIWLETYQPAGRTFNMTSPQYANKRAIPLRPIAEYLLENGSELTERIMADLRREGVRDGLVEDPNTGAYYHAIIANNNGTPSILLNLGIDFDDYNFWKRRNNYGQWLFDSFREPREIPGPEYTPRLSYVTPPQGLPIVNGGLTIPEQSTLSFVSVDHPVTEPEYNMFLRQHNLSLGYEVDPQSGVAFPVLTGLPLDVNIALETLSEPGKPLYYFSPDEIEYHQSDLNLVNSPRYLFLRDAQQSRGYITPEEVASYIGSNHPEVVEWVKDNFLFGKSQLPLNPDDLPSFASRIELAKEMYNNPRRTRFSFEPRYTLEEVKLMLSDNGHLYPDWADGIRSIQPGNHGVDYWYIDGSPTLKARNYLGARFGDNADDVSSIGTANRPGSGIYIPPVMDHLFSIDSAKLFLSMLTEQISKGKELYRPEHLGNLSETLNDLGQKTRFDAALSPKLKASIKKDPNIIRQVTMDNQGNLWLNGENVGKLTERTPEAILLDLNRYVDRFNTEANGRYKLNPFTYRGGTFYLPSNISGLMIYKFGGKTKKRLVKKCKK